MGYLDQTKVMAGVVFDALAQDGQDPGDSREAFVERLGTAMLALLGQLRLGDQPLEDALQDFALDFMTRVRPRLGGLAAGQIEPYVLMSLRNRVLQNRRDAARKGRWARSWVESCGIVADGDEEVLGSLLEAAGPAQLDDLPRLEEALRKAHPDGPLYVELRLKGYDERTVVGDYRAGLPSMLPSLMRHPITPQAWNMRHLPRIRKALEDHLR